MKFKPTIPTKRNKKEVSVEDTSKEKEGRDGFRSNRGRGDFRGRGRGGGRGRGRGRGLIVEEVTASGIFSLGPSAISSRARNGYAASSGSFATYGGDASSRFETENGSETDINVLFANATDGYTPTVFDHVGRLAGSLDPVDLSAPKKKIPWLTTKSVDEKDNIKNVKDEEESTKDILIDNVKKEKMDDDSNEEVSGMDVDKKEKNQVDEETTQQSRETWMMYEDSPAQNIFAVNEKNKVVSVADDELLFFQLPSVVPTFESPNTDNDEEMNDVKPEEEDNSNSNNKGKQKVDDNKGKSKLPPSAQRATLEEQMKSMDLEDMPDGQIGKIVIYKSGKMKLKIGSVLLDIEQGMQSSFLENVMVVDTNNETSKKAVELGHIVQKFTCAPNMDALLDGCEENYD
ncbi:RNA polymerase III RPC4-domain-containing protein [Cunninghamella echinulata]|nr:RNA polymerase III RPC4-domain-containing protein [Cunninghamella echinulata]